MSRLALAWPRRRGRRPGEVNLARRPFVNERPVRRAALLLAGAGTVLFAANLWLYVGYATERRQNEGELRRIESEIGSERQQVVALRRTLAEADLGVQNALVTFLNERIAERTFGWSVLFDRLSALLPADVRLESLTPLLGSGERGRARADEDPLAVVRLAVQGKARDSASILELVDALFADPAFRDPDLHQESGIGGEVTFTLDVVYLPRVAEALAGGVAAEGAAVEAAGEVAALAAAAGEAP